MTRILLLVDYRLEYSHGGTIKANIPQVRGDCLPALGKPRAALVPRTTGAPATVSRLTKQLETSLVEARRPESPLERPAELWILIN